jgi:hypothetical protein
MPDLSRVVPVKLDSLGEAINAACKLISRGAVVWQIKGAEGFMMERGDIEIEYWRRRETNTVGHFDNRFVCFYPTPLLRA